MRPRARDLTARARERIRAAREHDPHAWHHGQGDPAPIDFVHDPQEDEFDDGLDDEATPPLGSPESGAPDLDGAVGPGGVSGTPDRTTPEGGRPRRPAPRPTPRARR